MVAQVDNYFIKEEIALVILFGEERDDSRRCKTDRQGTSTYALE